ncbi:LPS export ABC transporter permease LptF [Oxalobacter vibrioformis]|uniref:Lipopolysaccharide export system permease protein LptF n=2 Tax=Oxalobacter vibrioformis TaxID=933080 RepID=A0A9E9P2M3_9BURK|nr:LPS export ABC transporter permease LptF [Oxalobacter vibrioformis]WAW09375.1 LPS export ABC transporter permease LptF [Oxalobacter vibrioformis]
MSIAGAVFMTLFTITVTMMLIRILGQAAKGRVASEDVVALIGFSALSYSPIIIVLTGFISVLLVITRSYQDSEMVVWFASGLSLTRWLRPILEFAVPVVILVMLFSFFITPWSYYQNAVYRARFDQREDLARVSPGKFQESAKKDRVFYVEKMAEDMSYVENVFIHNVRNGNISVVVSKEGTVRTNEKGERYLVLDDGLRYEKSADPPEFRLLEFERYTSLIDNSRETDYITNSIRALSMKELVAQFVVTPRAKGEMLWRVAQPIMAFLLMFLAVPLGFVNPRAGRSFNLLLALLLYVAYNNLTSVMQTSVSRGRISLLAGWWPLHLLIALIVIGLYAWRLGTNSRRHPMVMWVAWRKRLRERRAK